VRYTVFITAGGRAFFMNSSTGISVILKAEQVGSVFGFTLTNSLLMTWLVMVILIGFTFYFRRKIALIPGLLQTGIEWLFEGVLNYMTETLESEHYARKFFPLIMTIFLFVLLGMS
jgi:F0F1-type ATP synthase membrane subunit a